MQFQEVEGRVGEWIRTLAVTCFSARIASLSACLTTTDVLVDFLVVFSDSQSSGRSDCLDVGVLSAVSSITPSSSSLMTFFIFFFFLEFIFFMVFPGKNNRFLIGNLVHSLGMSIIDRWLINYTVGLDDCILICLYELTCVPLTHFLLWVAIRFRFLERSWLAQATDRFYSGQREDQRNL